jgi:hypothetical protein
VDEIKSNGFCKLQKKNLVELKELGFEDDKIEHSEF